MDRREMADSTFSLEEQIRKGLNADGDLSGEIDSVTVKTGTDASTLIVEIQITGPGPDDGNISTTNGLRAHVGLDIARTAAEKWRIAADASRADLTIKLACWCANCKSEATVKRNAPATIK
ncbi:MAG: hypothetical protein Q7S26_04385 [bacterium]|nr:hypothetical protein [bacterium]